MLMPTQIEELIDLVTSLDRPGLLRQFEQYETTFPLDFTPEFLNSAPLERLKHIFVAVCLQSKRMPGELSEAA
jgi:hypothetical protein